MSDNPTPSSLSSVPGNGGYRNKLNNWLQSRPGWRERFTWDKESHGPDDDPTWFAVGRCPFRFSLPVYVILTYGPQLMGMSTAEARAKRSPMRKRRLLALLSDALPTNSMQSLSSNAGWAHPLLNCQHHLSPPSLDLLPSATSWCIHPSISFFYVSDTSIAPSTAVLVATPFVSITM